MGMILYTQENEKGSINTIAGVVKEIDSATDDRHPTVITINTQVYNGETGKWVAKDIRYNAWHNPDRNMAERVKRLKLKEGAFVIGNCGTLRTYQNKNGKEYLQGDLFSITYTGMNKLGQSGYHSVAGVITGITKSEHLGAEIKLRFKRFSEETGNFEDFFCTCIINAAQLASLEKAQLAKWGNFAAVGIFNEDSEVFEVKRSIFNARVFDDSNNDKADNNGKNDKKENKNN
jgi:hypothetical protein